MTRLEWLDGREQNRFGRRRGGLCNGESREPEQAGDGGHEHARSMVENDHGVSPVECRRALRIASSLHYYRDSGVRGIPPPESW
jgi:hypothetical protein